MSLQYIMYVSTWVIICISLPATVVAIFAVCFQVRKDNVGLIYIINLLISDLIQLCCRLIMLTVWDWDIFRIASLIHDYSVGVSVGFMVCVALERYLLIAHSLWYRFKRTIKILVLVCVLVWSLPLAFFLTAYDQLDYKTLETIYCAFFLLPLPLFIFFLGGTLKTLSTTASVPSDEKRRIVGMLVLVLLIYSLLFLPRIFFFLTLRDNVTFDYLSFMFILLNPLADVALYGFMRKGAIDKLLATVCCCKMDSSDVSSDVSSSAV